MADTILHNQPEGTPSDNELIAYGTPTTPAGNIKLSNFYNLLMGKLGFFKVSNLFSEIFGNPTSMASARANLSVPSVSEMQTVDNLRALKTNVIEKDSTVAFTPTIGTHPVNKKYVDEKTPMLLAWGRGNGADGSTTYQTIRANNYISSLVFGREGTGSYVLTTNFSGNDRNIIIQVIPVSANYNETNIAAIWKRGSGVYSFLATADGNQNNIDVEYYIYYIN